MQIHICSHNYNYFFMQSCVSVLSCALLRPTLCDPLGCSPLGSSVHGILQARILEWVAMFSSRESSQPRDQNRVSCITGSFFTTEPLGRPKTWKQPKCPSTEEWIKNKRYIYSGEHYLTVKKEQHWVICRDVDGPRDCLTE